VIVFILVVQFVVGGDNGRVEGQQNIDAYASHEACTAQAEKINSSHHAGPYRHSKEYALCERMEVRQ
jgi:hypothetical protein